MQLLYLLEAGAFYALMGFFRILGPRTASHAGGAFARFLGPRIAVSRRAEENLKRAMPELSAPQRQAIIADMWENLGRTFAEYAHLDWFHSTGDDAQITVEGEEHFREAIARGDGVIMVSGHFANWELLLIGARQRGFRGGTVYRPLNNPYVNAYIERQRRLYALDEQIPKGGEGVRRIISVLKNKGILGMLIDQKMNDGLPVPFFGIPAMTPTAAVQLAMRYGGTLVPASIRRTDKTRFVLKVFPAIDIPRTGTRNNDVRAALGELNRFLEARIREAPSQWLWLHRRWPDEATAARLKKASDLPQAEGRDVPETN